jgi:hypothetical protein
MVIQLFISQKLIKKYKKTGNKHPLSVPVLPTVSRLACPLIYLRRAAAAAGGGVNIYS